MNKKGQSEVLTITLLFELIIGVLIASILMYAVLNVNNTSTFSKEYAKQDLMLVKEAVRSLPGDIGMNLSTGNWCLIGDEFVRGNNCWVQVTKTGDKVDAKSITKK